MDQVSHFKILIADDNAEIREFLAEIISTLGGTSVEASDGLSALQRARALQPDLILLDVEMPRMDGFAVCAALKTDPATSRIPIIMITSLSALHDRVKGIEAGADDYLTKPIEVTEFTARVKSLLRFKKLNESLESAENVVFSLARAIESKDKYTQGHTERVTAYALGLGNALGCPAEELTSLRQGGVLHDVGKISVPDYVLNKPGRLTAEEFDIIKQHPVTGFTICSPMKSLAHTLPCIRWHHEKPNGGGYPDGLKGREIPRVALILAVADVYDALTTKRSYKEAMPQAKALAILNEEGDKGGLDAGFVKKFIAEVLPRP